MKVFLFLATFFGLGFPMDFPWNHGAWQREQHQAADLIVPQRDEPPPPPDFPAQFVISNASTADVPTPQRITRPQTVINQPQNVSTFVSNQPQNVSTFVSTTTTSTNTTTFAILTVNSRISNSSNINATTATPSQTSQTTVQIAVNAVVPVAVQVEEKHAIKAELEEMQSGNDTRGVNFVVIALGPGNRNPEYQIKGFEWAWEGPNGLTKLGKRQSFNFGKILRERYGGFVRDFKKTDRLSSNQDAVQGTLQTFLAGIFPAIGEEIWLENFQWQPISFEVPRELLNLTAQDCPAFREIKENVDGEHTPFAQKAVEKTHKVIGALNNFTAGSVPSLHDADQIARNLLQLSLLQRSIPEWANQRIGNETLGDLVVDMLGLSDYFCAEFQPCRHFAAGTWLHDILKSLKDGPESNRTARIYATGSKELLSLLWLFGLEHERLQGGSGLLIEYRAQPQPSVRLVFSELGEQNRFESRRFMAMKFKGCDGQWCSLAQFTGLLQKVAIQDWKQECRVEGCSSRDSKKLPENAGQTITELQDVPDGVNLHINCKRETDVSGDAYCENWADHNYCAQYISVRDFYCRKTCLCKEKYRAQVAARLSRR